MTTLPGPDTVAIVVLIVAIGWSLLEHWRSRRLLGTVGGQLRRRWGAAALLVGLLLGYGGRLADTTPWVSRPMILTGVILLGVGYRHDRRRDA